MKLEQTIRQHLEKLPLSLQGEVLDYVLYLEQKNRGQRTLDGEQRARLAQALNRVVAINPFAGVDPARWMQEQRHDRVLTGRS